MTMIGTKDMDEIQAALPAGFSLRVEEHSSRNGFIVSVVRECGLVRITHTGACKGGADAIRGCIANLVSKFEL